MASNGISPDFRIPQEPLPVPPVASDEKPVPFVGSDEESFVVLGKSLITTDFEDLLSFDEEPNKLGTSIIQEAKQLIRDELERIDQNPVQQPIQENINAVPEGHVSNLTQSRYETAVGQPSFDSPNENGLNQSAVLPSMPQPQLSPCGDTEGNDIARTISIISFAPSEFASEELQTKVGQLIEENVHLKDTIMQNNMSMKAQYEKIVAWQKDVEKVHQAHKEKFRQAKQCIETLKKDKASMKQDNDFLQQEIENLRYSLKLHDPEHIKTKQILAESSQNNLKEFELDIANRRIKELEIALEKINIKDDSNLDTEKPNWTAMKAKLSEYERALDAANRRIKELEEDLAKMNIKNSGELESEKSILRAMEAKLAEYERALEEVYKKNRELEKNASAEDQSAYLEKIKVTEEKLLLSEMSNERANKEILSLRNQMAKNLQTSEESSRILSELQTARNKIEELQEMLTSRNASLIDANMRAKKMEELLLQANEKIKVMEGTVITLQGQLEETKIEVWKNKQKLIERETQLQTAQKGLQVSQYQPPSPDANEVTYLRQQLMQSQMAVTQSDQNRAVAYAQVEKLKNEIADLRRQLDEKQGESDAMFALRTQLDVYKADFEAEREAKEEYKRDKDRISDDLQHLHRRNQQLQEEIELSREQLKRNGVVPRTRPESSSSSQGASGWSSGRSHQFSYICPKCQFGFRDLQSLENHVQRCIDIEDSLP